MQLPTWNAPTSLTPEAIERRRRMAEVLMMQGSDASPVQHWTQGAARLAQALAGTSQMNRADTADAALRQQAEQRAAAEKAAAEKRAAEAAMMPDWKVVAGQGIYDMNPKRNPNGPLQVQKFNQAAKPRRIVNYNKVPYYEDTGERVLPNAQGEAAGEPEFKEFQTRDGNLAGRMLDAEKNMDAALSDEVTINQKTGEKRKKGFWEKTNPTGFWQQVWSDDSYANSESFRNYKQSAREWIAAILRKDTGAAVTSDEWAWYYPMYFPQPGDSEAVLAQKKASRMRTQSDLASGSGGAFEYFREKRKGQAGPEGWEPPPDIDLDGPALDLKKKYNLE